MVKKRILTTAIQFVFAFIPQFCIYLFINRLGVPFNGKFSLFFIAAVLLNCCIAVYFFERATDIQLTIRGIRIQSILYYTLIALVIKIVFGLLSYLTDFTTPNNEEAVQALAGSMPKVAEILFMVICGPIVEELAARGVIMGYLFKSDRKLGFVVSLLVFTMLHRPATLSQALIYLGMALAFCYAYYDSGRLEYSIILHILNNLSVLF